MKRILRYREFTEDAIAKPEEWSMETLRKMRAHCTPEYLATLRQKSLYCAARPGLENHQDAPLDLV